MRVTIFKDIRSTSTPFFRHIDVVLERIKSGASKELIESIQQETDKTTRNELKKSLPAICFSGLFSKRADNAITEHSGVICLDFDGYDSKKEMMAEKRSIASDEYVMSVFVSPSGDGLKVLVKIPQDIDNHVKYFNALERHFNSPHFDTTSKNISRVCYESYDKDIYVNHESKVWEQRLENEFVEMSRSDITIPITNQNKIVDILMKWWTSKYGMVDGERNQNIYILAAAFNDYGVERSLAEYIIGQFEQSDFPISEIRSTISSAYSHTNKFGTKFYEDSTRLAHIKRKIRDGATPKQIKSELNDVEEGVIDAVISRIDNEEKKFWSKNDKGAVSIVHYQFKEFLEDNGFYKFYPENTKTFVFVKVTNNLIDNTSEDEIKDYVLSYPQGCLI